MRRPTSALEPPRRHCNRAVDDVASTDIRPVLSGGGSSNNIITFAENLLWDPVLGRFTTSAGDHGAKTKFVTYREDTSKMGA